MFDWSAISSCICPGSSIPYRRQWLTDSLTDRHFRINIWRKKERQKDKDQKECFACFLPSSFKTEINQRGTWQLLLSELNTKVHYGNLLIYFPFLASLTAFLICFCSIVWQLNLVNSDKESDPTPLHTLSELNKCVFLIEICFLL